MLVLGWEVFDSPNMLQNLKAIAEGRCREL